MDNDLRQRFEDEAGDGWSGDAVCISVELGNDLLDRIAELEARLTHSPASDEVCYNYGADLHTQNLAALVENSITEISADSGMDGQTISEAEALWANLPTGRKWAGLATHEKALVCHQVRRINALTPTTLASADDGLCELEEWRRVEIQAIHAAISNRNWHNLERAANTLRDKMDAVLHRRNKP